MAPVSVTFPKPFSAVSAPNLLSISEYQILSETGALQFSSLGQCKKKKTAAAASHLACVPGGTKPSRPKLTCKSQLRSSEAPERKPNLNSKSHRQPHPVREFCHNREGGKEAPRLATARQHAWKLAARTTAPSLRKRSEWSIPAAAAT